MLIRRLRSDQTGMTLVELLVSMTLGLIILTAIMSLVQTSQRVTTTDTERSDATQRGRIAMERLVQGLRSQVCLKADATSPQTTLTAGSDTSVTFFADVTAPDTANSGLPTAFAPQQISYTYAAGSIRQQTSNGVAASDGTYTFPTVIANAVVLTNGAQAGATPIFRYYGYNSDGTLDTADPLPTPLAVADLPKVAKIDIDFVAKPTDNSTNTSVQSEFEDSVTLRLLFPAPKTAVQNRTVACTI